MTTVSLSCTPLSSKLKYTWDFSASDPAYTAIASIDLMLTDKKVSVDNTSSIVFKSYSIPTFYVDASGSKQLNKEYIVSDLPVGSMVSAVITITPVSGNPYSAATGFVTVQREPIKPEVEVRTSDNTIRFKLSNIKHAHESDGFSTITDYQVLYNKGEGVVNVTGVYAVSSEYLDFKTIRSDLSNNVEHEFSIRLKNAIGWGPLSATYVSTPSNLPNNISYLLANSGIRTQNYNTAEPTPALLFDACQNFIDTTNVSLQFPRSDDYDELIGEKIPIQSFTIRRHRLDASGNKIVSSLYTKTIPVDASLNSTDSDSLYIIDPSRQIIKYTDVSVPVGFHYVYGVLATNKFGSSDPRECRVRHVSLPSAPVINKVDPSNASVRINISKPSALNGVVDISSTLYTYRVSISEVSGNTLVYRGYKDLSVDGSGNQDISSFTDGSQAGSFVNGKQYEFTARLKFDVSQNSFSSSGTGTVTEDALRLTYYGTRSSPGVRSRPFTLPSTPQNVVCTAFDSSSISIDASSVPLDNKVWVTWTDLLDTNNGGVDGNGTIKYKIYKNGLESNTNVTKSPFLIDGNGNGSAISVQVRAYVYNSELKKDIISDAVSAVTVTPFKLPSAITNLVLDASGQNTLKFSFNALNSIQSGGLAVTYYYDLVDLSGNQSGQGTQTIDSSTNLIYKGKYTGLTTGAKYRLDIRPSVSSAVSSTSGASSQTVYGPTVSDTEISYFAPAAVTNLILLPSDKTIRADWDRPSATTLDASGNIYSNGVKITGYRVAIATVTNGVVGSYSVVGTTEPKVEYYIASGLTNGTTYSIKVYPVGVAGLNDVSGDNSIAQSIPQVGPSAVTGIIAEPSNSNIKFTWNAQGDNDSGYAGFAIYRDGEKLDLTNNQPTQSGTLAQPTWTWTNSGLTNGTLYNYVFYAVKTISGHQVSLISPATSKDVAPYTGASEPRTVKYTTTSNSTTFTWTEPSTLGGAGVTSSLGTNSNLIYTLKLYDLSGNPSTPQQTDYIKLILPVLETSNLTATISGLITNKTYRVVLGSYYTDVNGNKVYGAEVAIFPVRPNNPPLNVTIGENQGAKAEDNKVTLTWTLPTDASDAAAYTRDYIYIYRTITTGAGVTSARVLYATLNTTQTTFIDASGQSVSGLFKATGALNGNGRAYTGLSDSQNLPAGTIINGNTYKYEIVYHVTTAEVVQPESVVLTATPSGKVIVRSVLTQDTTNKKQFTIGLNKNGSNLADFLVVGLLPDGSGNLPLPVYQGTFADVPYTGNVPTTAGTQGTDNYAANQFFDWTFTLDNVPSDLMVVIENGNGFTMRTWPTNGRFGGASF